MSLAQNYKALSESCHFPSLTLGCFTLEHFYELYFTRFMVFPNSHKGIHRITALRVTAHFPKQK